MLRELGLMDLILLIPSTKLEENIELLNYSIKEIEELERLAEIGRATEKAFEVKPTYLTVYVSKKLTEDTSAIFHSKTILDVPELLDWAKED